MANTKSSSEKGKANSQSIIIAILSTVIVCAAIVIVILISTGVIKVGGATSGNGGGTDITSVEGGNGTGGTSGTGGTGTSTGGIIDNTYPRVAVNNANLAKVDDLEFYLPKTFEAGGKNSEGAYTYNLVNDDGWAQVLVYVEKTNLSPEKYLNKISSYLDITDKDYQMNGTSWVQGENASALAYATELDGTVYAVYYAVKLDSDSTAEAMSMIPKTLYMARIYQK